VTGNIARIAMTGIIIEGATFDRTMSGDKNIMKTADAIKKS
jgi:hypothetical protein